MYKIVKLDNGELIDSVAKALEISKIDYFMFDETRGYLDLEYNEYISLGEMLRFLIEEVRLFDVNNEFAQTNDGRLLLDAYSELIKTYEISVAKLNHLDVCEKIRLVKTLADWGDQTFLSEAWLNTAEFFEEFYNDKIFTLVKIITDSVERDDYNYYDELVVYNSKGGLVSVNRGEWAKIFKYELGEIYEAIEAQKFENADLKSFDIWLD